MNNLRLVDAMERKLSEIRDKNVEINKMTKMFEKEFGIKDKPSKEYYKAITLMNEQDYLEFQLLQLITELRESL
tara:strand:+ start:171 stop:392 length:222 start_codon:yes stop_codon:yes gene_type:complete